VKSIKNIFKGNVFIEYKNQFKEFGTSEPVDIILVGGKDDDCNIKMIRPGIKPRNFDGSARFEFNLTKNFDNIVEWIKGDIPLIKITQEDPYGEENWNEDKPKKSHMSDFIDNFDAYQGEGEISATKETPYTFYDVD
jgi:hypothetical protein